MKVGGLYRVIDKDSDWTVWWNADLTDRTTVSVLREGDLFVCLGVGLNGYSEILIVKDGKRGFVSGLSVRIHSEHVVEMDTDE